MIFRPRWRDSSSSDSYNRWADKNIFAALNWETVDARISHQQNTIYDIYDLVASIVVYLFVTGKYNYASSSLFRVLTAGYLDMNVATSWFRRSVSIYFVNDCWSIMYSD